jgi:hypothetical protein
MRRSCRKTEIDLEAANTCYRTQMGGDNVIYYNRVQLDAEENTVR